MSNLLKDIYSPAFYEQFSDVLSQTIPAFDKTKFLQLIFNDAFPAYELKERMTHNVKVLNHFLPSDFPEATNIIKNIIENLIAAGVKENSLEYMFLPEYVSTYGLDDYGKSVAAMEYITQFTSCEFAVRIFIVKYKESMLHQMLIWSEHPNNKVRRLASEGSRPRLPWAIGIPFLKLNPAPILPILENLKQDTCEVVRRSVANNMNDISKDHPNTVIELVNKWKGISKETDALIKHGCRTLLKQGHPEILEYYNLNNSKNLEVSDFVILTPQVKIGDDLKFSFTITNQDVITHTVRLEYAIYYVRQNGKLSKKVFKISERLYQPGEKSNIIRKQSFKLITTRKFYKGDHKISIIINGQEHYTGHFEITE